MKAQPPLWISPLSILVEALSSESVATEPQITNARVSTAVTPNTTRSVRPPWAVSSSCPVMGSAFHGRAYGCYCTHTPYHRHGRSPHLSSRCRAPRP